jgi:hypothetical protein
MRWRAGGSLSFAEDGGEGGVAGPLSSRITKLVCFAALAQLCGAELAPAEVQKHSQLLSYCECV